MRRQLWWAGAQARSISGRRTNYRPTRATTQRHSSRNSHDDDRLPILNFHSAGGSTAEIGVVRPHVGRVYELEKPIQIEKVVFVKSGGRRV
jgi:hypothetical protein